jgi:hypothetical protein
MTQNLFGHNPLKRFRQPFYSLDISPSNCYLFGKVKGALMGRAIPDKINLCEAATEI